MSRITPTCVGNTATSTIQMTENWDHPHLRGEYLLSCMHACLSPGSPPLAWGILLDIGGGTCYQGITPTCVGNTRLPLRPLWVIWDHPHLRGEYAYSSTFISVLLGSPPLAWGILKFLKKLIISNRITPTCVGNTLLERATGKSRQDHPHLRGEYDLGGVRHEDI